MLVYIHIPFCDSKCHYCAFNSYTGQTEHKAAYMKALLRQLRHELHRHSVRDSEITSVYLGGGTPSTIPAGLYEPLFAHLSPCLAPDAEITAEANPNSATRSWLEGMRALGVNRLSLGVQSFDGDKLRLLGRAHTAAMAHRAVEEAHRAGFSRLSVDLMYSTPKDTPAFMDRELDTLERLPLDHLSLYSLTIEEHTPFARTPEVCHERENVYEQIRQRTEAMGLAQYEVANFGTPSRHNRGYWEYRPYLGIGAGAVGRTGTVRTYPHKRLPDYLADPLYHTEEELDKHDIKTEKVLLGLRNILGFDADILSETEYKKVKTLAEHDKLFLTKKRVHSRNLFLGDELALYILD